MKRLAFIIFMALSLTACGGGSGGSSGIPSEPIKPTPIPTPAPTPTTVAVTGVSVSKLSLVMEVGNSEDIAAVVSPDNASNKNVTWKSEDPSVATVVNGKITAVASGNTNITVTTVDGGETATCKVTVNDATVSVAGVSLDQTDLSLDVGGDKATLKATVIPEDATNKNVTWESSDKGVATVSKGVVTPVAAGKATITVKTEDGGKTATCTVTVIAPEPVSTHVTSVALNRASMTMEAGTSETLIVTVTPSEATNKEVTWSSSKDSVASVDKNGKVSALSAGEAVITVKTKDGGKTATCKITVIAASSSGTSSEDVSSSGQDW